MFTFKCDIHSSKLTTIVKQFVCLAGRNLTVPGRNRKEVIGSANKQPFTYLQLYTIKVTTLTFFVMALACVAAGRGGGGGGEGGS